MSQGPRDHNPDKQDGHSVVDTFKTRWLQIKKKNNARTTVRDRYPTIGTIFNPPFFSLVTIFQL